MTGHVKNLEIRQIPPTVCLFEPPVFFFGRKCFVAVGLILIFCARVLASDQLEDAAHAFEKGDVATAQTIVNEVLRTNPNDASALGLLAVVLDTQQKYADAEAVYRRALAIAPNSASLLNNLGNHELAIGDSIAARKTFLRVIALRPEHPNANLQLAAIAADQKNGPESLHYLQRIRDSQPLTPQLILLRVRALYLCKHDAEADELLLKLSDSAPHDPQVTFSAGLALASVSKYEQAEEFFSRTLEAEPGDFDVLYNLGLAAFHAGHQQRADEVLRSALAQHPQDVDTLYNLAIVDIALKRNADAIPLLGQAARLDPARRNVQLTLAQTLSALGYYADAATAYEKYMKLAPSDETAQREYAFMLAICGRGDLGTPKLVAFVQSHPRDVTARYEVAVAESPSDSADAAVQLEKALALQPDFVPARFARGALRSKNGDFASALPDLEFAAAQYPDNALVLDLLGKTYIDLSRFSDAERALKKAADISPGNATVLLHLSRAYSGEGRKEEAHTALERFRALGPEKANHVPPAGMADLLSLPPEQLYTQYRAEVETRYKKEPQNPDVTVRYLKLLIGEGRTTESAEVATQLQAIHPPALLAAEAARALLQAGQYAEAKPLLQNAAVSAPTIGVQIDLALALVHTDGADSAIAQLDRVPEKQRSGDYYLARAQVLDSEGKPDDALADLKRALSAAPSRADLYEEATRFLIRRQRPADAVRLIDEAARALPDNRNIMLFQAAIYAFAHRAGDAERILRQIENRWPEWADPYLTYGILLEGEKRAEEAKSQLETALALGASGPQVYLYLAKSTLSATPERSDDAAREIEQAITMAPADPSLRATMEALAGRIAYERQDYVAALEHLHEAIRLHPNYLQARYTLAQTYRALGRKDDAVHEAESVQRLRDENSTGDEDPVDVEILPPTAPH